jgi:hypothetical protein
VDPTAPSEPLTSLQSLSAVGNIPHYIISAEINSYYIITVFIQSQVKPVNFIIDLATLHFNYSNTSR